MLTQLHMPVPLPIGYPMSKWKEPNMIIIIVLPKTKAIPFSHDAVLWH